MDASRLREVLIVGLSIAFSITDPSFVRPAYAGAAVFAECQPAIAVVDGDSLLLLPKNQRLVQPLAAPANIAACSLGVRYRGNSWHTIDVHHWDPQALAPDPTTVALRTRRFDASSMQYFGLTHTFSPAVVTVSLAGVADGRTAAPALEVSHNTVYSASQLYLHQQVAADPSVPVAFVAPLGQPLVPLSGPNAAIAHVLCGGNSTVADYRVVQCVMTTDVAMPPSYDEIAQHFRVTEPVTMHWAEIANALNPAAGSGGPVEVTVHTGGASSPPADVSWPLTRAVTSEFIDPYWYHQDHARWIPTFDFDAQLTLVPGQDYWLVVRQAIQWSMLTRVRTGDESPAFDAAIGPLMRRASDSAPWTEVTDRSLSFRLIGSLSAVTGTPAPALPRAVLTLRVHPNPARGPLRVEWSGASEQVRIEVLDAGGRAIGRVLDAGGASGSRWWDGSLLSGRRLPAGVYLLRATSGSAPPATQRVVLLR